MTALAIQHRDTILPAIASGRRVRDIAQELGVSHVAIVKALRNDPDYADALEAGLDVRLERAEEAIEAAEDNVAVTRARAQWSAATWRCEREASGRWGAKTQVTADVALTVQVVRFATPGDDTDRSHAAIPGGIVADPPQLEQREP